ncbi:hypothetical protein C1632_02455 [Microbacterium testaceum]|uniref:IPT/TIG domain-containing protein n=1 Tax=Microbacterium testaceum TaxID=2033 RepID=UPI000CCDDF68|nr:IPT/TIG domain-containing protein [Microbacterium testaceum]PNW10641.1 hypothetical protein C1632_02455 [Microbacterium testaceum]
MADRTIYDTTVPSAGSRGMAHQRILRMRFQNAWTNITGDANNLKMTPSAVAIPSERYGQKAAQASQKMADNYAVTFGVEAVRNNAGMFVAAQAAIRELLKIGRRTGADNLVDIQWFDALDDDVPAFQGTFRVEWDDANAGYAEGAGWSFTLTSVGPVPQITSPIATGVPLIETALPVGKTVGDVIYVKGQKFTGTTGVTIKAVAVTKFQVIDDNTLSILIPTGVSGASPIIVTNAAGASTAYSYPAA